MAHDSIIINQYNKRPFYQIMISDGLTTILWAWSSWLFKLHHFFNFRFLLLGIPNAVADPAVALISTSSALMLFNSISNTSPTYKQLSTEDVANHFNISTEQLNEGRNSQVCVVHHDEYGNITSINSKI